MVECSLDNYPSDCVAAVDETDFVYSQNFERYEVKGKAQWDTWLELLRAQPRCEVRVVKGKGVLHPPVCVGMDHEYDTTERR